MARVYERPRYINQARNRLLALGAATNDISIKLAIATSLKQPALIKSTMHLDYEYLAEAAWEGDVDDHHEIGIDSQLSDYLLDAEIGKIAHAHVLSQEGAARRLSLDYLSVSNSHDCRTVKHDESAMYHILHLAMSDKAQRTESRTSRVARLAAWNLIHLQLVGQKVSPAMFNSAYSGTVLNSSSVTGVINADAWLAAAENLQYRAQPMWVKYCRLWASPPRRVRQRVADEIEKCNKAGASERHRFFPLDTVLSRDSYAAYNYAGVIVVYHDGVKLVFDNSTADYIRVALTALRNARVAFAAMRVCGDTGRTDYTLELESCLAWIARAISDSSRARYVARHMHLAYTMWQNEVGEVEAEVDCGWRDRVIPLRNDMVEYYPHTTDWYDMVMAIRCPERIKAEFLKLYHLLPPPDIDPLLLHQTLVERTSTANVADKQATDDFIKFCMAYDYCRFVAKEHRVPSHFADLGYTWEESPWHKSCMGGKLKLPPRGDWGKLRISREFPYPRTGDFHVLDAKDSTRVVADLGAYMDRSRSRDMPRANNNELLSALFNGAELSNKMSMSDWRDLVMAGGPLTPGCAIAAEAGKAENTKPGKKVRETLSACDTLREYLTEVDHSLRPLTELTPGTSIRVNLVRHKKKFQAMARATSKRSTQHAFATSTDISGWSPKMDRQLFHQWQAYALGTTECPNPRAQVALWDHLEIFVDRRGVKDHAACPTGNIQGWPATSDTTMHAHILIYWAYQLREQRILSPKESAFTLCLIDDASTVVALDGSVDACVEKAKRARELLRDLYMSLGFVMDEVKSFFSSIKFVYLNELYVDGTQVAHGTKTMMRIDKDHTRRFASLTDSIATAFGTAASAAAQGADCFVAYWLAATLAYRWVFSKDARFMEVGPAELALCSLVPVSLNGLGIRPICSVMASGENDHLTWFLEVAGTFSSVLASPTLSATFNRILDQEARIPSEMEAFKMPFAYSAAKHYSATATIAGRFREASMELGLAEPFKSLEAIDADPQLEKAISSALRGGSHEAALLEEVSANMPGALVDQVMARIEKTEIVAYLLGGRGIGDLRRRVQLADSANLRELYLMATSTEAAATDHLAVFEADGSYALAHGLRERVYSQTEYSILNHTYPCPFSLWAFDGAIDLESDRARRLTTLSFEARRLRKTACSSTVNLYDSAVDGLGYRGYMTARSDASREMRVMLYDPVRKMTASGVAAFRWAHASGCHYRALYQVFLYSWGKNVDERLITLAGRQLMGSAKRLSLRHNKSSHLVYLFPNVQSAVKVDARVITAEHAKRSNMYDMMAAITSLRTSGLLEASLAVRNGSGDFAYGFTYHEKSAAPLVTPGRLEAAFDPALLEGIKAFVDIDGPMQASAKVCCSYDSMAKVAAMWTESGERAATRLFSTLAAEGVIDDQLYALHEQVAIRFSELVVEARPSKHAWNVKDVFKRSVRGDAVAEVGSSRSSSTASDAAKGTLDDQLSVIGSSWADTMLLELIGKDAVFATELMHLYNKQRSHECVNLSSWDQKSRMLVPHERTLRAILHEIRSVQPEGTISRGVSKVLSIIGASGYRSKDDDPDDLHSMSSFVGTTPAVLGIASTIGRNVNRLRHKRPEDYSQVAAALGKNTQRSITRVIKAQWLAAAARRQIRAAEIVERDQHGRNAVAPNYEAVFLRLAASLLRSTGAIDMSSFYPLAVTRVITSISNHLGEGTAAEQFEEALDAAQLDAEQMAESQATAEVAIGAVCNVANAFSEDINLGAILAALRAMCRWIESDLLGQHVITPLVARETVTFRAIGQVPEPKPSAPSAPIVVRRPVIGEEAPAEFDVEDVDPTLFAQWALQHDEARGVMIGYFGQGTHEHWYSQWSTSREKFIQIANVILNVDGMPTYTEPSFSMFAEPDWDQGSDDMVVD